MTLTARRPRVTVAVFPGTWSERDFAHVADAVLGWEARLVWHTETDLGGPDAVVLPGGFAHGDHLRTGAIARFSPIMGAVEAFAHAGGPVIGSCNGFQILAEAGLLPGALMRNDHLEFRCDWQTLRVESSASSAAWLGDLADGEVIRLPISHGEGRYVADPATLDELETRRSGRAPLRGRRRSGDRRRQSERVGPWDRRDRQRARQRPRPDAASGAGIGSGGRWDRWPAPLPLAGTLAACTAGGRGASAMIGRIA